MSDTGSLGFKRIDTRRLLKGWFDVAEVTIEAPDGTTLTRRSVVHRGAVAIAAVDEQRHITMVRQYRPSIDAVITELPAGTIDVTNGQAEDPLDCARRELAEEAGLEAQKLEGLGSYFMSPGCSDEVLHTFLATDLRGVAKAPQSPEELSMQIMRVPLDSAVGIALECGFDAKTIIGVLLARERLGR